MLIQYKIYIIYIYIKTNLFYYIIKKLTYNMKYKYKYNNIIIMNFLITKKIYKLIKRLLTTNK